MKEPDEPTGEQPRAKNDGAPLRKVTPERLTALGKLAESIIKFAPDKEPREEATNQKQIADGKTLQVRMAAALAAHEKRESLTARTAEWKAGREATLKALAALPQHEILIVWEAAGINTDLGRKQWIGPGKPPTRKPLPPTARQTYKYHPGAFAPPSPKAIPRPKWDEWQHTPNVRLFEACALSIDIDPRSMTSTGNDWMIGYPTLSTYAAKCFPNQDKADEYHLRQRVLWANVPNSELFPSAVVHPKNPSVSTTSLKEFAAWAVSVVKWEHMPPELVAMAQTPASRADAPTSAGAALDSNNSPISNERYWASAATWTEYGVLALFAGMNPMRKQRLDSGAFDQVPDYAVEKAKDDERVLFARLADPIREMLIHAMGHTAYKTDCAGKSKSPAEWVATFDRHGLAELVPPGLRVAVCRNTGVNAAPAGSRASNEKNVSDDLDSETGDDWKVKARAIADNIGNERWETGQQQITARNIAAAVTTALALDFSTHGRLGPRGEDNVRNEGLRGWTFTPPITQK